MIRPYGSGKFSTILDGYVYQVTLDGTCDEETGNTDGGSWYGLMRHGRTIFRDHDPFVETLNEDEQKQLTECAGVIVREDSDGFVCVQYYDTARQMDNAWANALAETMEDYPNT